MSRPTLRNAIIVLTLGTALIHFYLNLRLGRLDPAFTANGLGYLALLGIFLVNPPFLAGREKMFHYAYMAYTAVTIVAWIALGDKSDVVGYTDKVIEIALIAALWQHLRLSLSEKPG